MQTVVLEELDIDDRREDISSVLHPFMIAAMGPIFELGNRSTSFVKIFHRSMRDLSTGREYLN